MYSKDVYWNPWSECRIKPDTFFLCNNASFSVSITIAMLLNWILAYDSFDKQEVSSWKKQFEEIIDTLFQKFPTLAGYTGFPLNWKSQKIWTLT